MPVRNLILDLGGVLIDVDYEKTAAAFRRLGLADIDRLYSQQKQELLFDDMDKGLITNAEFRAALKKHLPVHVTGAQIDEAWNAMLGRIPDDRIALLQKLKNDYRLFLLSNTNRIHVEAFTRVIAADHGAGTFMGLFEKIYLSCDVRLRKPEPEIFNMVIVENKLEKSETVFIDDSLQHVRGAAAAGIPSHYLDLAADSLGSLLARVLGTAEMMH